MTRGKRIAVLIGLATSLLFPSASLLAAEEEPREVPVSVTALDIAAVEAIRNTQLAEAEWQSITGGSIFATPEEVAIIGVGAAAFQLEGSGLFDVSTVDVLSGPQGTVFGRSATDILNRASVPFYETQTAATVVVIETDGWPPDSFDELIELALAFNWAGDEVLAESPFVADPLFDFGNVSSYGWIGGSPFVNYAKIQNGSWSQFGDPLLRFETTWEGRNFVGYLLPGRPVLVAANLSYSPDATFETMVAQSVPVTIPTEIPSYSLATDFSLLDVELQTDLLGFFDQAETEPAEDPPTDDGTPADDGTTVDDESDSTSGSGSDEQPEDSATDQPPAEREVDEPQAAAETDDALVETPVTNQQATADTDSNSPLSPLLIGLIVVVGGVLAWLIYKWLFGGKEPPFAPGAPSDGIPDDPYTRNDPLVLQRRWIADVAERHTQAGGTITDDGWLAPTLGEADRAGENPTGDPDAWSEIFINVETFEEIGLNDPRYEALVGRFGLVPPIEHNAPIGMSTDVVLSPDGGKEVSTESTPLSAESEQPVFRTHGDAPEQMMTASEEALGLAEAMVGVVVDGWHLLPFDVGAEFFIPEGQTGTYRTIPVARKDVLTDVNLLGTPEGFGPDADRFGYWLHEDGTLKVGSPTDPHAFTVAGEVPSIEAMLPLPGPGQHLEDVVTERIIRAHELTDGPPPVDGWITPSNEVHRVGMLSDNIGGSPYDPDAWSGFFINVETQQWLTARDQGYDDLMQKLGVRPAPKPIETTEPIGMDDTPGAH